jgi:hypothetical protein
MMSHSPTLQAIGQRLVKAETVQIMGKLCPFYLLNPIASPRQAQRGPLCRGEGRTLHDYMTLHDQWRFLAIRIFEVGAPTVKDTHKRSP